MKTTVNSLLKEWSMNESNENVNVVIVHPNGTEAHITWGEFYKNNINLGEEELLIIFGIISNGGSYVGGGGVSPEWEIYRKNLMGEALEPKEDSRGDYNFKPKAPAEVLEALKWIVDNHQNAKINNSRVDAFSASAIVKVYDNLSGENQTKYLGIIGTNILKAAAIAFKLLK